MRLLALLALESDRRWTIDELAAASGLPRPSVHRELQRAVAAGLVDRDGSQRPHRFQAATESPLYGPLRELLELTVGLESELRRFFDAEAGVDAAVIHGSWARADAGPASDVDVVVVGHPDVNRLRRAVRQIGRRAGRRIDVTAFSTEEFQRRRSAGDGFVQKLLADPHVLLSGSLEAI